MYVSTALVNQDTHEVCFHRAIKQKKEEKLLLQIFVFKSLSLDPKVRHRKVESSNYSRVSSTYCVYLCLSNKVKDFWCERVILTLSYVAIPQSRPHLQFKSALFFSNLLSRFKLLPVGFVFLQFSLVNMNQSWTAPQCKAPWFTKSGQANSRNESLTNLLELLFLTVLALPKASSSGLDCRMMSLTCCEETEAMSC